ncbi:MAG: hypothetical protein ACOYT8_05635 [Candidatus Dependentiae bacterium]
MKHPFLFRAVLLVFLMGLCGCGRLIDWGKCNFYQGIEAEGIPSGVCAYVRTIIIYDQFTTVGIFDALWLSDEVRTAYAQTHSHRVGKNEIQENNLLRRLLAENEHFISFIILSLHEFPLGEPDSVWTVMLEIDGQVYTPIEIKPIELTPEYQAFFGNRYNRFKTAYMVKFEAQDNDENDIITEQTRCMSMRFRSIKKEGVVTWATRPEDAHNPCNPCATGQCCLPVNHGGCTPNCEERDLVGLQ